jgi:hypothetical protein
MAKCVGIWIDRREAIVVTLSGADEKCVRIHSSMESQERRAGDRTDGPYEPLQVPDDSSRDRKERGELARFYDEVITHIAGSDSLYICGPGETRTHLKHRIAESSSAPSNVQVEAADRMTDAQFIAKIRHQFQ